MGWLLKLVDDYLFFPAFAFTLLEDFTSPLAETLFLSAATSVVVEVSELASKMAEFSLACSFASPDAWAAACDLALASVFISALVFAAFLLVASVVVFAFLSVL